MLEKLITSGALPALTGNVLDYDRRHYPRFYDGALAQKFIVPIQSDYHRRLFPEIAFGTELPLFPNEMFGPVVALGMDRTPGNTIRKVYLCRAQTRKMRPGDLLLFYMSKDARFASSQSITTVGVIEQVSEAETVDDLVRGTAKRSVFSASDLAAMAVSSNVPIKIIDFLLAAHVDPAISLQDLLASGIIKGPPQSIMKLDENRYSSLRRQLRLA